MTAIINGKAYAVEFNYRKFQRKRRTTNGVTSCAIVRLPTSITHEVVTTGAAICSISDEYSRRQGRRYAFIEAVLNCGLFRRELEQFMDWFAERFPEPIPQQSKRIQLTPAEKQAKIDAGEAVRKLRAHTSTAGF